MNFLSPAFSRLRNVCLLIAGFCFLSGCATERSINTVTERVIVQAESQGKYEELTERLKTLEGTVSSLRSEVSSLESRLKSMRSRLSLTTYKLPKEVLICGERIPIEDKNVWENLDREFLVALGSESQILLWMKRARRYFPYIEKRLKELDLPDDLKYLTITESSLRPTAISSSGASGLWQFIPSTGEKFGMRRNRILDERFDFFKATDGALAYLKSLYGEFQSWPLSMAAYNCGESRVRREIEFQRTKDYFHLDLPAETKRYVYKIAAAKILLSDPERYGFRLEESDFYDPLQVERVRVELAQPLSLLDVAVAVGCFYKEIKEMNPHLTENSVPPGVQFLNIPAGTSGLFQSFLSVWRKSVEGR